VWISLVINTIIEKGPIIFLKLAEGNSGEIDGIITSFEDEPASINDDSTEPNNFLNFTRIMELNVDNEFKLAPRKNYKVLYYPYDVLEIGYDGTPEFSPSIVDEMEASFGSAVLVFFNTDLEKEYGIGR